MAAKRPADWRKLQPKLRMVADGDTLVNARRAEHAAALAVPPAVADAVAPSRTSDSVPLTAAEAGVPSRPPRLTRRADAFASIFVQLAPASLNTPDTPAAGVPLIAVRGDLATAELPIDQVVELRNRPGVAAVDLGQPLVKPDPTVSRAKVRAPSPDERRFGDARRHRNGADVLIGVIDVGGFDFAHPDFISNRQTRFVAIWDQGGTSRPSPLENRRDKKGPPMPFDYGSEIRAEDLNRAIAAAPRQGLPPHRLEPQSQMTTGSHGTHVASIAAGNRGVCRRAKIAGVLIAIPDDDLERRKSFYDSTRIAHAVDYLLALGAELGLPVSINVSLGTNGHAHDDSSPVARWLDSALARPGRCICVAAGNAGQEKPESEGDIGYVFGRVHSSGRVAARELTAEIEWLVVGNGIADVSENELEIWYGPQDRFGVQVKPPGGKWTEVVSPGEYIENRPLPDGSMLSVYNELYHPANGANLIAVYLSPFLGEPVIGVTAGEWLVRLVGQEVRDGRFHAWIERDDPRPVGRLGSRETWVFPSYFSERSVVDHSTISSLACGPRVIAVANLDQQRRRVNASSSQGPTRDDREKPDVCAPGTEIVAAKGFSNDERWVAMTGTSMSSPFVTGVVGLMLGANPHLTSAQISGIMRRTAKPLPGSDFAWRDDAGAGEIDPARCIAEAAAMEARTDIT